MQFSSKLSIFYIIFLQKIGYFAVTKKKCIAVLKECINSPGRTHVFSFLIIQIYFNTLTINYSIGIPGSNAFVGPMSDIRCFYIYENQRWNPVSGFTAKGLPTDRYMWSDKSGRVECTKDNTHLPSCRWQWVCIFS